MTATLTQVQGVLDKVIRAIEFLFGFTLATGLVVLFAAVTATRGTAEEINLAFCPISIMRHPSL